jgi:hypothetical protein
MTIRTKVILTVAPLVSAGMFIYPPTRALMGMGNFYEWTGYRPIWNLGYSEIDPWRMGLQIAGVAIASWIAWLWLEKN